MSTRERRVGGVEEIRGGRWLWRGWAWVWAACVLVCAASAPGQCVPSWAQGTANFHERSSQAMAHDSARSRTICFGGYDGTAYLNDTLEHDGTAWVRITTASAPQPRQGAAMAFDSARARIVLFGGAEGGLRYGDVWEYDGASWVDRTPAGVRPSARVYAGMAFDAARGRVVLFGGGDAAGNNGETWEWTGSAWVSRGTAGPGPRAAMSMSYDSARARVVLYGGFTSIAMGDTWEWNGTSWQLRSFGGGASEPPPLFFHQTCFASGRGTMIFAGSSGSAVLDRAWRWDGTAWSSDALGGSLPADVRGYGLVFDNARGRALLAGGTTAVGPDAGQRRCDSWEWSPAPNIRVQPVNRRTAVGENATFGVTALGTSLTYRWRVNGVDINNGGVYSGATTPLLRITGVQASHAGTYSCLISNPCASVVSAGAILSLTDGCHQWQLAASGGPGERSYAGIAYDRARDRIVLFGGQGPVVSDVRGDTWAWNGSGWVLRSNTGPLPRRLHVMAYDSLRQRTVMFGGQDAVRNFLSDTWEWDGTTWTQAVVPGPSPRSDHGMAFDASRGRVVLYGGQDGLGFLDETWEWDGCRWVRAALAGQNPGARCCHAMAYDSVRARTVLFGGGIGAMYPTDTWEFDGLSWQQVAFSGPPGRIELGMAFDSIRGRTLIYGGGTSTAAFSDSWEWDGFAWRQRPETTPVVGTRVSMAFDAGRDLMLIQGGRGSMNTFTLSPSAPPVVTQHPVSPGSRCAGTGPVIMSVSATGANLTYQWKLNGVALPGRTAPSITITTVTAGDGGTYTCLVSSSCASVESNGATLMVLGPPTILTHPQTPISLCAGQTISLSVTASSSLAISFQWQKDGFNIPGATSASYVRTNAGGAESGEYRCVATNACGSRVSNASAVTIAAGISIIIQPTPASACVGQSAAFTVGVNSVPDVRYQWRRGGVPLANGPHYSGVDQPTLMVLDITTAEAGLYSARVTSASCFGAPYDVTSDSVPLAVSSGPAITQHPQSQNVCQGGTLNLSVFANGTGPISHQWRRNGIDLAGHTQSTLTVPGITPPDAGNYDCLVSNSCGSVFSNVAVIGVTSLPQFTLHPTSQTACVGGVVVLRASATGASGYQWRKDGSPIPGATGPEHAINPVSLAAAGVYVAAASGSCGSVDSQAATLTVGTTPVFAQQPVPIIAPIGGSASFSVAVNALNPTYRWRKDQVFLMAGARIPSVTSATLIINALVVSDAGVYDCVVNSTCGQGTSAGAALGIDTCPFTWAQGVGPTARAGTIGHSACYDAARGDVLIFGGGNSSQSYRELWGFRNNAWALLSASGPVERSDGAMAFDEPRSLAVLFGGRGFAGGPFRLGDTWEWNGVGWTQRFSTRAPAARDAHAMIYDTVNRRVVLFGGLDAAGEYRSDTWAWNGADWTPLPAVGPTPRGYHAMAFDEARGVIILFGGRVAFGPSGLVVGDTWEFDGTAWSLIEIEGDIAPRSEARMVYDRYRRRVVLFGGRNDLTLYGDTWERVGGEWLQRSTGGPTGRLGHAMVYDTRLGRAMVVGGATLSTYLQDAWVLGRDLLFREHPADQSVTANRTAVLHAMATGPGPISYRWKKNGVNVVDDGRITGATSPTLTIRSITPADEGSYALQATSGGCVVLSDAGTLTIRCPADLDDGSGTGTPDGGVTIDDLLYYLGLYALGDVRADVDDGTFSGTPDGGVTIDDLLYFLARYEGGC